MMSNLRSAAAVTAIALLIATSAAADEIEIDRFGCEITQRPDELKFTTIKDAWRSLAAREIYTLRRHEATVAAGVCDCAILRPSWSDAEAEFRELGFLAGPWDDYRTWKLSAYEPHIDSLRQQVTALCEEPAQ